MDFIRLPAKEMTPSFFSGVYYAVWDTYNGCDVFKFLNYYGKWYESGHPKELDEFFPVVKHLDWSIHSWRNWTWYYKGMGGGAVFVHKFILKAYKKYAGIVDNCMEYGPNYDAAEKAWKEFRMERARRFTWEPGDLVFYKSREELEKAAAKEGRKVTWYN